MRPKLPRISEEMKQWSAMLGEELSKWPKVSTRPMFGFSGFYRGRKIFAALPLTRGVNSPNAFMFRIKPMPADLLQHAKGDARMNLAGRVPRAKWFHFEVNSEADLRDALWWLNQAYDRAR